MSNLNFTTDNISLLTGKGIEMLCARGTGKIIAIFFNGAMTGSCILPQQGESHTSSQVTEDLAEPTLILEQKAA